MTTRDELFDGLDRFLQHLFNLGESEGLDYLTEQELSLPQVRTLLALGCADEPLPVHRVAEELGQSVPAAGRNVDRLVRLGAVERRESTRDRRVKLVSLTAKGRTLIDQHLEVRRTAVRRLIDRLPDAEVDAFADVIDRLHAGGYLSPHAGGPIAAAASDS